MRRGRHAAEDGSFNRSAGGAVGRGVLFLALALGIGVVLLNEVDAEPPGVTAAGGRPEATTTTTVVDRATTTTLAPVRAPAEIRVLVANASGINRAASKVTDRIRPAGYNVLAPVDATQRIDQPFIYHVAGLEREARLLAQGLGLDPDAAVQPMPDAPPVADRREAELLVIVNQSLANADATPVTLPAAATADT